MLPKLSVTDLAPNYSTKSTDFLWLDDASRHWSAKMTDLGNLIVQNNKSKGPFLKIASGLEYEFVQIDRKWAPFKICEMFLGTSV